MFSLLIFTQKMSYGLKIEHYSIFQQGSAITIYFAYIYKCYDEFENIEKGNGKI